LDLCVAGDASIESKCGAIFRAKVKGKIIEKGVAFPTCVNVNECVCNNSPLVSEGQEAVIAEGDLVKIDLGVHIDGYIAVVAHTLIVGATQAPVAPVTGVKANVFHAAASVSKVVAKLIAAGNTSTQVIEACNKVIGAYEGVRSVQGVTMHQMKRYIIDGNKTVVLRPADENAKVEVVTFEPYEVYAVDICLTSGEGKSKEGNSRTTVYKRNVDKTYQLKMQAARKVFNEINRRFPTMPFTLRSLEDEKTAKLGIRELVNHDLLSTYSVVFEKPGDVVVHVRFTLLLLPGGTLKITGLDVTPSTSVVKEDGSVEIASSIFGAPVDFKPIDESIAAILNEPVKAKKDKKKKK